MKKLSTLKIVITVILIACFALVAVFGFNFAGYEIKSAKDSINLGLDLAGGVYVLLEADTDKTGEELSKAMEQSKAIIQQRVDGLGISEPNISIEGSNRISIELAGAKNAQDAIETIGKTAQLQFIDPDNNVILTGKNIKESKVVYTQDNLGKSTPVVSMEFDEEGTQKFAEATTKLYNEKEPEKKILKIVLDGEVISAPIVQNSPITDGKPIIEGGSKGFTVEEASKLATLIRAGALPIELKEVRSEIIGASLGIDAFDNSMKAIVISILLISILLIIVYKIPGIVAAISLVAYTLLVMLAFIIFHIKLSLPGICGLLLSIGMAVDANCIIYERIREELLNGKTVRSSVDAGFKKAISTIMDSNITTIIAGVVLYVYGIGSIRGFGITLIIGIVISLLTAVVLTRFLLKNFAQITANDNKKAYGA